MMLPTVRKEFLLGMLLMLCTIAEAKRGFLFICDGDCEPWQIILMVVSCVCVLGCCCAGAAKFCSISCSGIKLFNEKLPDNGDMKMVVLTDKGDKKTKTGR